MLLPLCYNVSLLLLKYSTTLIVSPIFALIYPLLFCSSSSLKMSPYLIPYLSHHPLTLHFSLSIPSTRNVLGKPFPAEGSFYRNMGSSATVDDDGLPGSIRYNPNSQTNSGTEKEWERERSVLTAARRASQSLSQWDQHMPQPHHTLHPQHSNSVQRPISHTLLSQRQGTAGCMEDYLTGVIALAARNVMNDFALLNEKVNHCGDIVLPR